MTEEASKKVCKGCRFRDLRVFPKTKSAEHFCIEANSFIRHLPYCPLTQNRPK